MFYIVMNENKFHSSERHWALTQTLFSEIVRLGLSGDGKFINVVSLGANKTLTAHVLLYTRRGRNVCPIIHSHWYDILCHYYYYCYNFGQHASINMYRVHKNVKTYIRSRSQIRLKCIIIAVTL